MNNRIFAVTIAITICVVLVGSVLVPVIKESESEIVSYANNTNGLYAMVESSDLDDYVIEIGNSSITVNGELVADNATRSFVVSDSFIFRSNGEQCYGADSVNVRRVQTSAMTLTISDGTFSYLDGGNEYSGELSFLILPDPKGNLGFFQNTSVYATTNAPVYYVSTGGYHADPSGTSPNFLLEYVNGEMTRSLSKMVYSGFGSSEVTTYEGEFSLSNVYSEGTDKFNGVYSAGTFTWAPPSGESEIAVSYIIAPIEYKYLSESDRSAMSLLYAIPAMIIVALISLVVRAYFRD